MLNISYYLSGLVCILSLSHGCQAADNVRFHGTLVSQPCVISPGEEAIPLDFGTVIDKYLYQNQRTSSQRFVLHLTGCDLSLGSAVDITFTGMESAELPGLLALDTSSQASGIAIGLETSNGESLPINKTKGYRHKLMAGENFIPMQAYVQAEPTPLASRTISKGPFTAVVTFNLNYE